MADGTSRALAGKRVIITRAAAQSETLAGELSARGAIPVVVPLVSFADPEDFGPLDAAIEKLQQFDWLIFTSAQAVRSVVNRAGELNRSLIQQGNRLRIAVVGPVTAEAGRKAGLPVEYVAETHTGAALAEELRDRLKGAKALLPRSDRANPDLPAALKRHGARVTEVIAYRTLRPEAVDEQNLRRIAEGAADAVLFFSPSAVQNFVDLFGGEHLKALQDKLAIVAVGPVTATALDKAGTRRIVKARDTTAAAVVEALEEHFADSLKQVQAGAKRV